MESNISPIQRQNFPPEVRKDEEGGPTSQPMGRTSYRYTSSTVDVEGYQWVVNSQMCGSGVLAILVPSKPPPLNKRLSPELLSPPFKNQLGTLVPNAGAPFQTLFQELEHLGLASPAPPTPPTKQEYMAATQASREGLQYRETEQSLEEILYLPSCG